MIAGGPAPLIATALLAATGSGYVIAAYIAFCAVVTIIATVLMPDHTNRDISQEHAQAGVNRPASSRVRSVLGPLDDSAAPSDRIT